MDYELCLFKAMNHLRIKHPHIYITLDITDVKRNSEKEEIFIEASFDTKRGRYLIEVSEFTLANVDVDNLSALIHNAVLHIVYGNVLIDKEKLESAVIMSIAQDAVINEEIPLFKSYKNEPELGVPVLLEHIAPHLNSRQHTSSEVYNYMYDLYKEDLLPESIMALILQMESENENDEDSEKNNQSGEGSGEEDSEEGDEESDSKDSKESKPKDGKSSGDNKPSSKSGKLRVVGSHKKHGKTEDSEGKGQSESMSELQKSIAQSLVNNMISENEQKFIGTQSASIKRLIDEMKKSEYDFKKLFEMAVKRSINSERKSTWMRQNRRFGDKAKGYKPRPTPKVLIVIDLSGSINGETIKMINWMIHYLQGEYDFHACWGDTKLEGFLKIQKGDNPKLPFKGGGGTNLNFFAPLEEEYNYDLVIFATDGYIPEPLDTPSQKIFCIYDKGREVPDYENIFINPFA
jgi:predicted metal-dependent peptidase